MPEPLLEGVTILAPEGVGLAAFLAQPPTMAPFAPERLDALGALSARILADPDLKRDPGAAALAFWLRPARLEAMARTRLEAWAAEPTRMRSPVGRVYHVAPANVDTLFLYSWALSFLCGNADVVRLPGEHSPLMIRLLEVLDLTACEAPVLAAASRFVTHGHDAALTARFSEWCDHRIVWGGDDTVRAIRAVPLHPHASERCFAGKVSHALLAASAVLEAASEPLARLASALFRDLFWFGQRACSSPKTLFWLGSREEADEAATRLEAALAQEAAARGYQSEIPDAVHRFQYAVAWALEAPMTVHVGHGAFLGLRLGKAADWRPDHCGGGLLVHLRLDKAADVISLLDRQTQTLTHFGLPADTLRNLAPAAASRGLDRLVPLGEALAFEEIWDGFDLIQDFTRILTLRL